MRPLLMLVVCAACLSSGCGTLVNLNAPPPAADPESRVTPCFPFGGVTRSAWLSGLAVMDVCQPGGDLGLGGALCVGLLALMDTPLSLAGDVLTLPVAFARQQGASWATAWGFRSGIVEEKALSEPEKAASSPPSSPSSVTPREPSPPPSPNTR